MTKQRKFIPILLGILVVCLALGGFLMYQSRFAKVGENRYEKTIESIDLSGAPVGDLGELQAFPGLKNIDLRGSGLSIQQFEELKMQFPEAQILWDIPFQGGYLDMNTQELTLTSLTQEDMAVIPYFTELKTISADECPDYQNLHQLRQQRPDLAVSYQIPVAGASYGYETAEMILPGADAEELMNILPYFEQLTAVELTAPLAPIDQIQALLEAFPQVSFSWNLEVGGIAVNEKTETLDLTGIPMTVEEMDAVLPYLLSLTYVDMSDCGISNEEMEALNNRYEDIKIVWTVILGRNYRMRTDATYFHPVQHNYYPQDDELYNLRYCHDIIMLDVGHMPIDNCDFVAYMPHLKYLILAETPVHDLTPLTGLKELVFLELFIMQIDDLSPLVTLTSLEDLNLHYTYGDPTIIAQMTWLKNLWWNHVEHMHLTWSQMEMLREAIPGCNFDFECGSSTGGIWRTLPNYYAQRDAAGVGYMIG